MKLFSRDAEAQFSIYPKTLKQQEIKKSSAEMTHYNANIKWLEKVWECKTKVESLFSNNVDGADEAASYRSWRTLISHFKNTFLQTAWLN